MEQFDAGDALRGRYSPSRRSPPRIRPTGTSRWSSGTVPTPVQPHLPHRRRLFGGHLALEVHEAARHRHLLGERLHLGSEHGGQLARRRERVADPGRDPRRPPTIPPTWPAVLPERSRMSPRTPITALSCRRWSLAHARISLVLAELQVEGPGDERGGHRQHRQHENRPPAGRTVATRCGGVAPRVRETCDRSRVGSCSRSRRGRPGPGS